MAIRWRSVKDEQPEDSGWIIMVSNEFGQKTVVPVFYSMPETKNPPDKTFCFSHTDFKKTTKYDWWMWLQDLLQEIP